MNVQNERKITDAYDLIKVELESIKHDMNLEFQYIKRDIGVIQTSLDEQYVKRSEFLSVISPIRAIVYGFVGLVLTGVATAILALVIKS